MSERETSVLGRYGRFVWGGAAALLLLVLLATFVRSGSAESSAERKAQERAEHLSAIVAQDLTPDLVTRDIDGTDYLALTVRVQAGLLTGDRFVGVRIWRIDGGLIYSTGQADDVKDVRAGEDPWIGRALDGQTVSVRSSEGTYHEGLGRPSEELFQTFIPIRLWGDAVVGVVEIDQRYDAIHGQASHLWRPVQVIVLMLLIGSGVMLARTLRGSAPYGEGGIERRTSPGRRADDLSVREAVDRADRAERRARKTEKRLAELQAQLERAPSPAIEELDLNLRASEAEREELAGTVKRLQGELAESQAEVTLAREGSGGTRAETKRVNKLIADAEGKAVAAEHKAAAAERKAQEAAKRSSVNAERGFELEAQLREAQELAADAERRLGDADRRVAKAESKVAETGEGVRRNSGDRKVAGELKRAEGERDRLASKLDELERALAEARVRAETSERELARLS